MRKFLLGMMLVILLSGCNEVGFAAPTLPDTPMPTATTLPLTATPEPTVTPQPPCMTGSTPAFTDYATLTRVNPKPIQGHETFVNIYVDNAAKDVYLSASGEVLPVCARIVKTHLASEEDESITAVTVMVKMPAGYDTDHNDWWWAIYEEDGKVAQMSGKVQVCIACHQPATAMDYVFSQKVMEEIHK